MKFLKSIWLFLGKYQTPRIRDIHLVIVFLVLLQILLSNGMHFSKTGQIADGAAYFFTIAHILFGLVTFLVAPIFIFFCFKEQGLRCFYPYLWGDFKQIKADFDLLRHLKLPESKPKGLAKTVQGLGIGALMLVVLSGIIWFVFWLQGGSEANSLKNIHKMLTGLIEVYIVGHGAMAILHFIVFKSK